MNKKVLVLAPHPDDEILGTGGIIYDHLNQGDDIKVALVTNGDGYLLAQKLFAKKLFTKPQDLIDFGYIRRQESIDALKEIGLNENNIQFLNFPDGHLKNIFFQKKLTPYIPPRLKLNQSPYSGPTPYYTYYELLSSFEQLILSYQPDVLYTPHTNDVHSDHWVTALLVKIILAKNSLKIPQYQYLIHWRDHPQPRKLDINLKLKVPTEFRGNLEWITKFLSTEAIKRKGNAIGSFKSQRLINRYLYSFVRNNELFAIDNLIKFQESPQLKSFKEIKEEHIITTNAIISKLKRGNITKLSLYNTSDKLYIDIQFRKKLTNRVEVYILTPKERRIINQFSYPGDNSDYNWKKIDNHLYLELIKEKFNFDQQLIVSVFSYRKKKRLDKTGWYSIQL